MEQIYRIGSGTATRKLLDDFRNQRFDIRLFLGDFFFGGFDFTFPFSYIKRAGTDINK